MKWATRPHCHIDRAACAWLIRRFIDPEAQFVFADDRDATPQSRGLLAIAEGFHLLELDDHRQLELSLPLYDALYAWCRAEVEVGSAAA